VGLYRKVLHLQPNHFDALNNLATLLAERADPLQNREAMEYIDRAIQVLGPQPEFLDTKAMILVYRKKPAEALALLNEVTSIPHADPRAWLHLAVAYHQLGQDDKAREALARARKDKLDRQVLTQADHDWLAALEQMADVQGHRELPLVDRRVVR
jgi:Flp pilus assembly protein TadD